jgi:spermidine/putrescine transport system ATP-binding protein
VEGEDTVAQDPWAIEIRDVTKIYGDEATGVRALDNVAMEIADNEFFTLLGPSGCGKTTLLRCIAGFEQLSDGEIFLFGEEIENLPPNKRPVNTVFQQYALFPHMTVAANVAFGLKMLKRPARDIATTVDRVLRLVHMDHLANRRPTQLSGGQQQRVALARALATEPKVLLLDEPLSALDLKLRQAMRVELKQLQEETGITFIFVTHDQVEALTMSDRIAVMSEGRVQQVGTPSEVYERPVNHFVADFIGETNFFDVTVASINGGQARCVTESGVALLVEATANCAAGDKVSLSVRPEGIRLVTPGSEDVAEGVVERPIYQGTDTHYMVGLPGGQSVMVRVQNMEIRANPLNTGDKVALHFDPAAVVMLTD